MVSQFFCPDWAWLNSWRAEILFFLVFLLLIYFFCYMYSFIRLFVLEQGLTVYQASLGFNPPAAPKCWDCRCKPACSASVYFSRSFRSKTLSSMSRWGNWHKETALCLERGQVKAGSSFRVIGLELTLFFFVGGRFPPTSKISSFCLHSALWPLIYIISLLNIPLFYFDHTSVPKEPLRPSGCLLYRKPAFQISKAFIYKTWSKNGQA